MQVLSNFGLIQGKSFNISFYTASNLDSDSISLHSVSTVSVTILEIILRKKLRKEAVYS